VCVQEKQAVTSFGVMLIWQVRQCCKALLPEGRKQQLRQHAAIVTHYLYLVISSTTCLFMPPLWLLSPGYPCAACLCACSSLASGRRTTTHRQSSSMARCAYIQRARAGRAGAGRRSALGWRHTEHSGAAACDALHGASTLRTESSAVDLVALLT
jgi:hypothetical protein